MANVHPTAIVHSGAELDQTTDIGPYCVIGAHVRIGPGTRLMGHVFVDGHTTIGPDCMLYPFCSIGTQTQDLKFKGGAPRVVIGSRTTVREYATVNAATNDGDVTQVGSGCLLMTSSHVAHDCAVGDDVIIANCGTLAGHVTLEDQCIIGGLTGIHQFVRIGTQSIIGGCSKVTQDIPPYMMADGHPLRVRGINRVGLERRGVGRQAQRQLKGAFRILYRRGLSTRQALESFDAELEPTPEISRMIQFIRGSERGIAK